MRERKEAAELGRRLVALAAKLADLGFKGSVRRETDTLALAMWVLWPKCNGELHDTLRTAAEALQLVAFKWGFAPAPGSRLLLLYDGKEARRQQREHCDLLVRLGERLIGSDAAEPVAADDGPFGINGFRWQGREKVGLTPKMFKLVDALWRAKDRTLELQDASESVYGDDFAPDDGISSCRRHCNSFFRKHSFPLVVSTSGGRISLVLANTPAKGRAKKPASRL